MNNRSPGPVDLPVVIPRCPLLDPGGVCYIPPKNSWLWTLAVVGVVFMIPESAIPGSGAFGAGRSGLSGLPASRRKRRGNRLLYMWQEGGAEPKTAMRGSLDTLRRRQREGQGTLYAVWAASADQARQKISRGEASLGDDQMSLFKAGRVLKLKAEDPGKSEDRLMLCLERRGWKPKRVSQLQASISEKLTPDMFTGKTQKLTGGEVQMQEEMDVCLDRMKRGLAGVTANCGVWQEVYSPHYGKVVARCLKYAPRCDPPAATVPYVGWAGTGALGGVLRTCIASKQVKTQKNPKGVMRCSKYAPTATTKACLPETMPPPEPEPEIEIKKSDVMSIARALAAEANALEKEAGPALAREIMSRGGIAPHARGREKEEYKRLPLVLKRKTGLPMDEMASEMGLDESTLARMIDKTYGTGEVKRKFTAKDFEATAYRLLEDELYMWPLGFAGTPRKRYVRYQKGSIVSTMNAALKTIQDKPLYIFPTHGGFVIEGKPPPFRTSHMTVKPDGSVTQSIWDNRKEKWVHEELSGPKKLGALAGPIMTCVDFYDSGRCKEFAPTCSPPGMKCATETAKFEPRKPKKRKAPKRKKRKARKKKRKPQPYLGPEKAPRGGVQVVKPTEGEAINAAARMIGEDKLYIARKNGGYAVQTYRPPRDPEEYRRVASSRFLVMHPNGILEQVKLQHGGWVRSTHPSSVEKALWF